ncbi:MAG: DUF4249 domain-containing protein [Bacteroidota bacterium]
MSYKKYFLYSFTIMMSLFYLSACDLEREIDIDLPETEVELVVECYLEDGQPYRLALSQTVSFLEPPGVPDVPNAEVTITINGETIVLEYDPILDEATNKIYNYRSRDDQVVDANDVGPYFLRIFDRDTEKLITAQTSFLPVVPFEEVSWEFEDINQEIKDDSALALVLIRHFEAPDVDNYYRLLISDQNEEVAVDFNYQGLLATDNEVTLSTIYQFKNEDTLRLSLYHFDERAFDYFNSVEDAADVNGNPFAQPVPIQSGVEGGLGVFAALAFDRRTIVIQKGQAGQQADP